MSLTQFPFAAVYRQADYPRYIPGLCEFTLRSFESNILTISTSFRGNYRLTIFDADSARIAHPQLQETQQRRRRGHSN